MKKKNDISALKVQKGMKKSQQINPVSISKLKEKRKQVINENSLITSIVSGDISALSKAITLVESKHPEHQKKANTIVTGCLAHAKASVRIGITGVPGVGKSTFIETFGTHLIKQGKKVAVLAVDPSSSITKGSILGDKTRMESLVKSKNAFIRPSPSGDALGGVAKKTRETVILCEAAGFDTILIETVGVGQSETIVHSMVDFFLLLKLAGAGDELQGIKRGIIEMADAIVINKADGSTKQAAKLAKLEFNRALHLYPKKASEWTPKATTCSALHNEGIAEIWDTINLYLTVTKQNHFFEHNRNKQNKFWLLQHIETKLKHTFFNNPEIKKALKTQMKLIENNKTTPFAAAEILLSLNTKTL